MYRDVVDVVEQAGHRLDTMLIPKVGVPADVYLVDALLTQIEEAKGIPHRIGIDVLIETALGMANVEAIAQSSRRLEAMHFGVADYAASCRARTVNIGGLNPDYPGDQWHAGALAHGGGLPGLRTPTHRRALRRLQGSRRLHRGGTPGSRARASKGSGRSIRRRSPWPTTCSPRRPREVERARRILDALEQAAREGRGAAQLDGRMIDAASARMAQNVVDTDEAIRESRESRVKSLESRWSNLCSATPRPWDYRLLDSRL